MRAFRDRSWFAVLAGVIVVLSFAASSLSAPFAHSVIQSDAVKAAELNEEGVRLFADRKYAEARRRFEDALELDPDAAEIRTNLGKTFTALAFGIIEEGLNGGGGSRVFRQALAQLRAGLLHWEGDGDTHYAMGRCHFQLGEFDAARRSLERAVKAAPKDFVNWRLLGLVHERLDQLDDAERAYRRALEIRPGTAEIPRWLKRLSYDRKAIGSQSKVSSERFRVFYPPELSRDQVETLLAVLDRTSASFERRWHVKRPRGITVLCYPPGAFGKQTGLHESVGGAFDGRIRIAFPSELSEGGLELEQVARHETVHLLLRQVGDAPPRWLDEGIAQLFDGDPRREWEPVWTTLLQAEPRVGIEQRRARFREDDPSTWAPLYLHGFFFLRHVQEIAGDLRIDMLVREAARGAAWGEAFERVFSISVEKLDREWRRAQLKRDPEESPDSPK